MLTSLMSVIISDIFLNMKVSSALVLVTSEYVADGTHMILHI